MADAAALRVQSYFRGYLSRGLYGALRRGAKAAAQDAANRETLRQWVEANVAKHGPQTRYQYTRKAADRLAASQRKRCTTKTPQGHAGVFAWLPPGVALARTAEAGRLLVAARAFGKGDVVFVEAALLSVAAPDDYTDEADDAVHLGLWEREVDAFDALDAVGRRRVLTMHAAAPPPRLAPLLEEFSRRRPADAQKRRRLPLIFSGNALEAGDRFLLPVMGSLIAHGCDASVVREANAAGGVEFVAVRPIACGEALSVDYLGQTLWPRARRREWLRANKGFECACARCQRPDLESSIACPRCVADHGGQWPLPLGGLVAPPAGGDEPFVELAGRLCPAARAGRWVCSGCADHAMSNDELGAIRLPAGAPAGDWQGLAAYADSLGAELLRADPSLFAPDCDRYEAIAQHEAAILMCVGRNHWASYVAPLRRLRGLGEAVASGGYPADAAVSLSRLEAEAEQLWRWIDALLGLQPVSYISPTALTDLARLLGRAGQKSDARKWAARVVAAAPAHSEVYAAAASVELGAS